MQDIKTNTNTKTFYCDDCDKYYSSSVSLHNHKRLSTKHHIKAGLIPEPVKVKKSNIKYVMKYKEKNKDKIKLYLKEYYKKNKDKFIFNGKKINCMYCKCDVLECRIDRHNNTKKHMINIKNYEDYNNDINEMMKIRDYGEPS
jgi:hypothetical protein